MGYAGRHLLNFEKTVHSTASDGFGANFSDAVVRCASPSISSCGRLVFLVGHKIVDCLSTFKLQANETDETKTKFVIKSRFVSPVLDI